MSYSISYVPSAAKAVRKLDRPTARCLLSAIGKLAVLTTELSDKWRVAPLHEEDSWGEEVELV